MALNSPRFEKRGFQTVVATWAKSHTEQRCLMFFAKHVDEGKTALPASTFSGCAALSFLPTMFAQRLRQEKILRVNGSKKTF